MNRARMVSFASIVICLLLVGAIAWQQFQIIESRKENDDLEKSVSNLQQQAADLKIQHDSLKADYETLNKSHYELTADYEQHLKVYQDLRKYFFIQDSSFNTPLNETVWWGVEAWNKNEYSVCEVKNGLLHLFYNGTIGWPYGNSGVFQGVHTDGRCTYPLLIGDSPENSFHSDYVIFSRDLQSGEFLLKTKFRISKMGFTCYPDTTKHPNYSRVNLGITLMCALNNQPFNLETQTLWLDTYFAGYCLNTTHTWTVSKNWSYENYVSASEDIFAGYFVDEFSPQSLSQWNELSIDLGDYITKTLDLITQVQIDTIRVYGFILFVECLGAYAEVDYDYAETFKT